MYMCSQDGPLIGRRVDLRGFGPPRGFPFVCIGVKMGRVRTVHTIVSVPWREQTLMEEDLRGGGR